MEKNVTVYSTPTCPYCTRVKEFLKENKVEFTSIDVSTDEAAAQQMVDKSGQMGVPVLDVDGTVIVGFDKPKIQKALGI